MKQSLHVILGTGAVILTLFVFMACCNPRSGQAGPGQGTQMENDNAYVHGEVLVQFKATTSPESVEDLQKQLGLEIKEAHIMPNLYLMKIEGETSVPEMVEKLTQDESVEYAEPNYKRTIN